MSKAPTSEAELLTRVYALAGLRLGELAEMIGFPAPAAARHAKGWMGELIESVLGADAGNRPEPDFTGLGIELKTVPVNSQGVPQESTYVCRAPSNILPEMHWANALVRRKLARVLWLPLEAATEPDITRRRIGWGILWSPTPQQAKILQADWEELMELLAVGRRAEISARIGSVLQLRPKAADAASRASAPDEAGAPSRMPPHGFYLRAPFTREILAFGVNKNDVQSR
jgi:DNA mismatch repair protein MutH